MENNSKFIWFLKPFQELTPFELYKIIQLRVDVFMLEQTCLYSELDNKDLASQHLFAFHASDGALIAYARILPSGVSFPDVPSIGRVLVHSDYRSQRLGRTLMERSITATQVLFPNATGIRISAQAHLENFYQSLGFVKEGETYLEDGIDHIQMFRL